MIPRVPPRPSAEDIHDLRVTIRRIQMMSRLLPKRIRNSEGFQEFSLQSKSFMKSTSLIRDIDTLTQTLESLNSRFPDEFLVSLKNERSDAAVAAGIALRKLAESQPPILDSSDLAPRKLSKMLRRQVKRVRRSMEESIAASLNDETDVESLHTLRKKVKRLRYLLELSDNPSAELGVTDKWQDELGAIHDFDVAINYLLTREPSMSVRSKVVELRRRRHQAYSSFSRGSRRDVSKASWNVSLEGGNTQAAKASTGKNRNSISHVAE